MENLPRKKKKTTVPNMFKFMVAVSSLAGTVGIWNVLANKDLLKANADFSPETPFPTATDFQPIPTLIPLVTVDMATMTLVGGDATLAPTGTFVNGFPTYAPSATNKPPAATNVVPTKVPPTNVVPTKVPPTNVPPTNVPPTVVVPTVKPPTVVPPTVVPPTPVPPTPVPPTPVATTKPS